MAVTDRYTNYQKRKEAAGIVNPEEERQIHDESVARQAEENAREQLPLRPTVAVQKPATSVSTVNTVQERENADKLPVQLPGTEKPWQEMSAQEAYAAHPQLSPAAYLSGVASYRKKKGQEGLSYTELAKALRGRDPLQSEEDRINAERRLRAAESINAVGSVLANLVNVVRTRRGNPSMNLSGAGREGQARIDRIRQYRDNLSRQNYQDYIGAIARDRAEQARIELNQAKQKQFYDKLDHDAAQKELERQFKIDYSLLSQGQKEKLESIKDKHRRGQISLSKALELKNRITTESRKEQFIDVPSRDGRTSKRYSQKENGNNWITTAYKDVLEMTGGDNSPYKVKKESGFYGSGSTTPTNQEMYESISKYAAENKRKSLLPNGEKRTGKLLPQ